MPDLHRPPRVVELLHPHAHAHILHLKQLHTKMDTGIQLFCLFGWRIHANQLQRKRSLPEASDCQIQIQCSVQYLKKLYSQVHWHNSDILLPAIPAYKKNAISGIMLLSFSIYIVNKSYVSVSRLETPGAALPRPTRSSLAHGELAESNGVAL